MEHLIPPGATAPIRVQLVPPQSDDGLSDDEEEEMIRAILSPHSSPSNAEEAGRPYALLTSIAMKKPRQLCHFLQLRLWIGLLQFVLKDNNLIGDFIQDGGPGVIYLKTDSLERHLQSWKEKVDQLDEESKKSIREMIIPAFEQAAAMLRNVSQFLEHIYLIYSAHRGSTAGIEHDPVGMTHFACVLLHQALVRACSRTLGFPFRAGSPFALRSCTPWLRSRMVLEGWCPYTVWRLYVVSDVDELVYGYFLGSKRITQDHSRCIDTECIANTIRSDAPPQHTQTDCGCEIIYPPLQKMMDIIGQGGVPILRIKKESNNLVLEAEELNGAHKYVAMSHVWADGLGSLNSNSIFSCQLERILDRLVKLDEREHCGELFLWIDTLCIPVDPDFQDLRDSQILKMYEIYKNAHCTLAIDLDFLDMNEDAGIAEIGMRLYLSAWCSRLWTYEEGSLAQRVFLMSREGIVDVDTAFKAEMENPSSGRVLTNNLEDVMARVTVFSLGRPHYDSNPSDASNAAEFYKILDKLRAEGDADAQKMLYGIRDRTSSRPDDEAIVIAASLGINTLPVLRAPPEDRMVALIKTMPHVPANLLFTAGPRLTHTGFRWAPASVLRAKGAVPYGPVSDLVPMSLRDLETGSRAVRLMSKLDEEGRGLVTFNPAIGIKKIIATNNAFVVEMLDKPFAFSLTDANYSPESVESERMQKVVQMLNEDKQLVILVPTFDPTSRIHAGVLVETLSEIKPLSEQKGYAGAIKSTFVGPVNFNHMVQTQFKQSKEAGSVPGNEIQADWLTPRFWLVD